MEHILCRELLPAVTFCFSKKRVDLLADMLPNLDFTTPIEKSKITVFFDKAISRLKGTDKELPQILRVKEMLKRGLGVHHAGKFAIYLFSVYHDMICLRRTTIILSRVFPEV